jgi:uncharacterized RDD family membrane protein YckC
MKCPKCGYQSFNHLTSCKKCGRNLADQQEKLGFDRLAAPTGAPSPGQPEPESPPSDDNPALEESLHDFFESLEEPLENDLFTPEEDPFAESPTPASGDLEPEDSPFGTLDENFAFEDSEDEDPIFSFDDMEEEPGDLQQLEREDEKLERDDEPFVLNGFQDEEEEEKPEPTAEYVSETASILEEDPEETGFLSFADLDAELDAVEESDQNLDLNIDPNLRQTQEPFSENFVSPKEIEQAMAEDAVSKARTESALPPLRGELEQGEFPFAGNGMPQEVFLREEEDAPRSVLGLRLLAILTDLGILSTIFAVFVLAGEMVRLPNRSDWFSFSPNSLLDLAAPYFLVLFTLCFGYFTLFHFLTGQTPGKMLWRVRVEGEAGIPLSLAQAFLRSAGGLLALLPAGLGFLSIVVNHQRRGWNDRLANSRVVMAGPERP